MTRKGNLRQSDKDAIKRYHEKTYKKYNIVFRKDEDVDIIAARRVLDQIGIKANIDFRSVNHNVYNGGSMTHSDALKKIKGFK